MLPPDPETPGGLGLFVVDELCETWGVSQDLGPTCVWCELLLDQPPPSEVTVPVGNAPTLSRSSARRWPCVTAVEAFVLEPPGGDPTVRSAIGVADPVPG